MRGHLLHWLGPTVLMVLATSLYVWFVAPVINDLRDDWTFLHDNRQFVIQRAAQQAAEQKAAK